MFFYEMTGILSIQDNIFVNLQTVGVSKCGIAMSNMNQSCCLLFIELLDKICSLLGMSVVAIDRTQLLSVIYLFVFCIGHVKNWGALLTMNDNLFTWS